MINFNPRNPSEAAATARRTSRPPPLAYRIYNNRRINAKRASGGGGKRGFFFSSLPRSRPHTTQQNFSAVQRARRKRTADVTRYAVALFSPANTRAIPAAGRPVRARRWPCIYYQLRCHHAALRLSARAIDCASRVHVARARARPYVRTHARTDARVRVGSPTGREGRYRRPTAFRAWRARVYTAYVRYIMYLLYTFVRST